MARVLASLALTLILPFSAPLLAATSPVPVTPAPVQDEEGETESDSGTQSVDEMTQAAQEGLKALMEDPAGTLKEWAMGPGAEIGGKILLFLVLLLVSKIVARVVSNIVAKGIAAARIQISDLLKTFAINTSRNVVFFLGILFSMATIGIPIGPFLAAFGVVGFVVGFALQDTMSNFASGVMILLYRPYDIGDVVNAGGVTGKVEAQTLVSTTMVTPDNQRIIVPNGSIWGGTITNITANDTRRVDLTAGIGYDDDIDKAEAVLARIVESHEKVLKDPAPVIKLHELADSSVNFVVRIWSNTSDYWDVYWDVTKAIKVEFDKEGISIPYPQQDVHMHEVK